MDFDDLDIAAQSSLQDLKKEIQLADPATCLLYTSPSPRDATLARMPSSA